MAIYLGFCGSVLSANLAGFFVCKARRQAALAESGL
jgi:hypothetical protein